MKKAVWWILAGALLCGCASGEPLETVADEYIPDIPAARQILVQLPDEAAVPAVEGDAGRIYLCDDYEIVIQTLSAGDMDATIRELSGYERENLTVLHTEKDGLDRYDFVWAAAGEQGDQVGRAAVLDDGNYHYTLTVLRPADMVEKSQIVWRTVFESFTLEG